MFGKRLSLGGSLRVPASCLGVRGRLHLFQRWSLSHQHSAALLGSIGSGSSRSSSDSGGLQQQEQTDKTLSTAPVAIVGAGPAGLTLSALLSKFGVPSILLEKSLALPTHPQAHFINLRSMEIMRHAFEGLDRRVLEKCPPQDEWRDFVMCSTVLGRQLARVDNFCGGEAERRALSPTGVAHLSQNVLLPLLLEEAERAAAKSCPSTQILFDAEVAGLRRVNQTGQSAGTSPPHPQLELSVRRRRNSTTNLAPAAPPPSPPAAAAAAATLDKAAATSSPILCKYVVAADGAGSSVRRAAGIALSGRRELGNLVNIHFRCKELGRLLLQQSETYRGKGWQRPGMLYFVYNEETICVLVAHNVQKGEWACQVPFFPPHQTAKFFTSERSLAIIREAIGPGSSYLNVDICSIRPWTMNALVADSYFSEVPSLGRGGGIARAEERAGEPGVILVGDAAHQFPPAGGFGLNTGVQDAHNLAWKLAAVYHGLASPELLLTYEEERRPVAMRNAALSVRNLKRSLRVLETLGVDPSLGASAEIMDQLVHLSSKTDWAGGARDVAASRERSEERTEEILRLGRRQLQSLRVAGHPYGESRVRDLRRLLAEGGGLPLLFPDHDVGFRYSGEWAAVCREVRSPPTPSQAAAAAAAAAAATATTRGEEVRPSAHGSQRSVGGENGAAAPYSAGILHLGGRMPHFILRPSRGDSGGHVGLGDSGVLPLSTVDLPDQIRGLLLSRVDNNLPSAARLPGNDESTGNTTMTAAADSRAANGISRASAVLASVLIVSVAAPNESDAAAVAEAVKTRWLRAAIAAQEGKVGGGRCGSRSDTNSAGEGQTERGRLTPVCPLVVLMVSPPSDVSKSTTTAFNTADTTRDNLKSTLTIEDLEAYLDHRYFTTDTATSKANSAGIQADATAATGTVVPRRFADAAANFFDGNVEVSETASERAGLIFPMHAVDDRAGRLGKAFSAAGAEAVLLRPDGHIAWIGRGRHSSSCDKLGGYDDPMLVGELRGAMDSMYAVRKLGGKRPIWWRK